MKNKIKYFLIICFITLNGISSFSQTSKKNNFKMDSIKYAEYVGKEVFIFLLNDNIRGYEKFIFFDNKPGVLSGGIITIDTNCYIEIYVSEYKFQKQFSEERHWDKLLFYKETINRIKVFKSNKCILDTKSTQ